MLGKFKKVGILRGLFGFLLLFLAILTGGGVCGRANEFRGRDGNFTLVDGLKVEGLDIGMYIKTTDRQFKIPFVFWGTWRGGPYSIRLDIWDRSQKYRAVEVNRISLAFEGEEEQYLAMDWRKDLRYWAMPNSTSQGIVYTETMFLSDFIPDVFRKHEKVEIEMQGRLMDSIGKWSTFTVRENFEKESHSGIMTLWKFRRMIEEHGG